MVISFEYEKKKTQNKTKSISKPKILLYRKKYDFFALVFNNQNFFQPNYKFIFKQKFCHSFPKHSLQIFESLIFY
jgi:hypothetical protein